MNDLVLLLYLVNTQCNRTIHSCHTVPRVPYQTQIFAEGRLVELVHDELDLRHGGATRSQTETSFCIRPPRQAQFLGVAWILWLSPPPPCLLLSRLPAPCCVHCCVLCSGFS